MSISRLINLIEDSSIKSESTNRQADTNLQHVFEDGENYFHKLVKCKKLNELEKIKYIFVLSDADADINLQTKPTKQTCLHLAVNEGLADVVYCLLQNGADLTLTDFHGLCPYNYARRLSDKELSRKIINKMQSFFPTYWIGIENCDINIIRKLVNSWCRFKVKRNGKYLIEYAKEKDFTQAVDLFTSLETQMDLCFAVLACNIKKCASIIRNNLNDLKMSFKNMKENGATLLYYAIKQKNLNLLKTILETKQNILTEYVMDELGIDFPLYFLALNENLDYECLELLTPNITNQPNGQIIDISCLSYKGLSFLRYSIEINLDINILEKLMSSKYCSRELITQRDPEFLTSKEYATKMNKPKYAELIDKITINYILNNKPLRNQLALNGFDFDKNNLRINDQNLIEYAQQEIYPFVVNFLKNVTSYQNRIDKFHTAVEKNDYHQVKLLNKIQEEEELFNSDFSLNLINSKRRNESQSVFHKCVLNSCYEILNLLMEVLIEDEDKYATKLDNIRDHCYRTPMHYANGIYDNKRLISLLSQFGFSENVFDKDGITPLDFQERVNSIEVQELVKMHRDQVFDKEEPNPWTWKVWTRIQREKDTLKQLISFSHPHLQASHSHSHSHSHGHGHGHNHGHSHDNVHLAITSGNEFQSKPENENSSSRQDSSDSNQEQYSYCAIL